MRILFESAWILAAMLGAVQFVLIAIWSWRRSRGAARMVWIGFAGIPALLILSAVVVTPRERITAICQDLAHAVELKKCDVIAQHLSEDFEADGLDKAAFLERAEAALQRYNVYDPELRGFEVTFLRKGSVVATFDASGRVESPEALYGRLSTGWRLTFRRLGDIWRVSRIETLPVPPLNAGDVRDVLP